jgi:multiple sugar transport system substrate-binding protein
MIAGISKFAELLQKYGAPDQAAMSWPETLPLFMNGKVAMMVEVSHCGGVFEDPKTCAIAGKIGYALPPKGPSGNRVQWTYTDGFTINKDSKHKEATWLFMQWRSSFEENMKEVQDGLRYDVTSNGVLSSKEYRKALEARGILDYAKILEAAHKEATTVHLPRSVVFVKIAEAFQTNVSLSVAGEIDVKKAMQNAQKEIEKIMNEAN